MRLAGGTASLRIPVKRRFMNKMDEMMRLPKREEPSRGILD